MEHELQHFINRFATLALAITTYDSASPVIIAASEAHATLTGYSALELVGKSPRIFKGPLTCLTASAEMKQALAEDDFWHGTIINYKKDGSPYAMQLTIFGISVGSKRYYAAIKVLIAPIEF